MALLGIALSGTRTAYQQLHDDLSTYVDFQAYAEDLDALALLLSVDESGVRRINFERTELVVIDNYFNKGPGVEGPHPDGGVDLYSQLAHFVVGCVAPYDAADNEDGLGTVVRAHPSIEPKSVVIAEAGGGWDPQALIREVVRLVTALGFVEGDVRSVVESRIHVTEADVNNILDAASEMLIGLQGARAANRLILSFNEQIGVRKNPLFVFTSAKGGSGKTACSLLFALAVIKEANSQGHSVNIAIAELDLRTSQLLSVLDFSEYGDVELPTVSTYIDKQISSEALLLKAMLYPSLTDPSGAPIFAHNPEPIRVLLGPHTASQANNVKESHVRDVLTILQSSTEFDLIIVDTLPDPEDRRVEVAMEMADEIVYVTEDTAAGREQMRAKLATLVQRKENPIPADKVRVLANSHRRVMDNKEIERFKEDYLSVIPDGVRLLQPVPYSISVDQKIPRQTAFSPFFAFHVLPENAANAEEENPQRRDIRQAFLGIRDIYAKHIRTRPAEISEVDE